MKKALRRAARVRRAAISAEERIAAECAAVAWLDEQLGRRTDIVAVAVYISVGDEFPTEEIIETCRKHGKIVAVPRWEATENRYRWVRMERNAPLVYGPMRVPEPGREAEPVNAASIGLYLVPGLAYDDFGTRLGYGGGWFDRLLAEATPSAIVRGLYFPSQHCEQRLPREVHDIPVEPIFPLAECGREEVRHAGCGDDGDSATS